MWNTPLVKAFMASWRIMAWPSSFIFQQLFVLESSEYGGSLSKSTCHTCPNQLNLLKCRTLWTNEAPRSNSWVTDEIPSLYSTNGTKKNVFNYQPPSRMFRLNDQVCEPYNKTDPTAVIYTGPLIDNRLHGRLKSMQSQCDEICKHMKRRHNRV